MGYRAVMDPDADLAAVASLIADRHRAQMLLTLLGGTPQSGSALAEAAGISRSLASAHLKKLVAGGLVRAQPSGRQQLYSIASEPVADVSQPVFPSVAAIDLRPGTTPAQRAALVRRIVAANPDGTDGGTYELPRFLASSVLNAQHLGGQPLALAAGFTHATLRL